LDGCEGAELVVKDVMAKLRSCRRLIVTLDIHLLDVVALTGDLPERGLLRGQVGTIVEKVAPGVFEVEFSDDQGRTYAQAAIHDNQLMVLHYQPQQAA
jgi:hypothetical protein